jgi:hypothetical protein
LRFVHIGEVVESHGVIGVIHAETCLDPGFDILSFNEGRGIIAGIIQLTESLQDSIAASRRILDPEVGVGAWQ